MSVAEEIDQYIASQPEAKAADLRALHEHILQLMPGFSSARQSTTSKPSCSM